MIDAEDGKMQRNLRGGEDVRSLRLLLNCQRYRDAVRQCPADAKNYDSVDPLQSRTCSTDS